MNPPAVVAVFPAHQPFNHRFLFPLVKAHGKVVVPPMGGYQGLGWRRPEFSPLVVGAPTMPTFGKKVTGSSSRRHRHQCRHHAANIGPLHHDRRCLSAGERADSGMNGAVRGECRYLAVNEAAPPCLSSCRTGHLRTLFRTRERFLTNDERNTFCAGQASLDKPVRASRRRSSRSPHSR